MVGFDNFKLSTHATWDPACFCCLLVYLFLFVILSKQGKRDDDPRANLDSDFFGPSRKKRKAVDVKPRKTAKRSTVEPIAIESSDDGDVGAPPVHVRDTHTDLNLS